MKLSIIILTWNSERFIVRCIEALKSTVNTKPLEWVVVDNGSGDSSLQLVKKLLPEANIIQNKANLGVSRARNQGIIASTGEFVLLLDDDTQALPYAVDLLCDYLNQHPGCAMVAPQLVNPDGSIQINALPFPSVREKTIRIVKKLLGIPLQNPYSESLGTKVPFQPGYLLGACQLIRRKAITATGLLDERMFYGPEDADYCLRLKKQGFQVICLPAARIIHAYQRQSYKMKKIRLLWAHFTGLIYFWLKHYQIK